MDRALLVDEFEDMGLTIPDDMIDECAIACHANQISASDLVGSWIAHCASSQIDANGLNKERLSTLIKSFDNDKDKANNKKHTKKETNVNQSMSSNAVSSSIPSISTYSTNINLQDQISVNKIIDAGDELKEDHTSSYSSGDIACEFGRGNIDTNNQSAHVETVSLLNQILWDNFKFCQVDYKKLDLHIQNLAEDIIKKNNLEFVISLSDLCFGNDNVEITIYGCLKLIKKELFLTSIHGSIKLDLSEAVQPINQLFANQIVVVTGINPGNKVFKVRKIFTDAKLPLSKKLPTFQGNLKLIVAAGPFFSETSPHGKSLKSLIQKTIEFESKLLILLGPIFETDFGTQLNNASSESIQNCYDDVLESILKPLFSNPSTQNTKVLIFSSWKDVGAFALYPTPPNRESRLPCLFPNNIYMVSDPSVLTVNDIIMAGNASDSLMGLHVSAINQKPEEMFAKLAKQIVWQRSLHPSCTANPNVPIDLVLWLKCGTLQNNTPHIIFTSSQLRTFIRVVEGTMVINVGQLVNHNSQKQGTYGVIQISPSENDCWSSKTNIFAEVVYI